MTSMPPPLADAVAAPIEVPDYLRQLYWWAYVHPRAVRLFERQWLVNAILWGNFARLRDAALAALGGAALPGATLQVACVYGDLSARLLARVPAGGRLDVVDVLPVQLENLRAKLGARAGLQLHHGDARALPFRDAQFDRALLFFLLHEQPEAVRRATLAEALRVLRPGGRLVIVDYHAPARLHPLRVPMRVVLGALEPHALELWRSEVARWLPPQARVGIRKRTCFGGLYQILDVTRA